jgi:hypothetical protein
MWIIVLSTLLVAFISGVSIGTVIERGLWESALGRARRRIEAHRDAADRRRRFRVIDGGAPEETHPLPAPSRGPTILRSTAALGRAA